MILRTPDTSLPDTAICLHCGYSLRGLPENVCPECGRGFDPADPTTWRESKPKSEFWQWIEECPPPSNWFLGGMATGATLLFISAASVDWPFHETWGHLAGIAIPLMVYFVFPTVLKIVGRAILGVRRSDLTLMTSFTQASRRRWRLMFVFMAIGVLPLIRPSLPFEIRWAISRPFLDHKAALVRASGQPDNYPQSIGLFRFRYVSLTTEGQVRFEITSDHAFVRDPQGASQVRTEQRWWNYTYFSHLGGDWYTTR